MDNMAPAVRPPPIPQPMELQRSDVERLVVLERDYQHLRYVVMTMRKEIASSGLSGPQGRDSKYRPAEEPFGLAAIVKLMVAIPILSVAFSALLSGNHELAMKLVKAVPVP